MSIRMLITTIFGCALFLAQVTDAGRIILFDCKVKGKPTSCNVRKAPCKNAAAVGKITNGDTGVMFTTKAVTSSHTGSPPGVAEGDERFLKVNADDEYVPCTDDAPDITWKHIIFDGHFSDTRHTYENFDGKEGWVDATCISCS